MELKFIKKNDQVYDVSRVRDLSKCCCDVCDFMNCPYNNYDYELTRYIYPVEAFISFNCDELLEHGFTRGLIEDFFEDCVKYPAGFFFEFKSNSEINIINQISKGKKSIKGIIYADGSKVVNIKFSKEQYLWALEIMNNIKKVWDFCNDK